MKFSLATSLIFLIGIASALPANVTSDGNDADSFDLLAATDPIDFLQAPSQSAKKPCGGNDYTGKDILLAAQKGVNLQLAGQIRGSKYFTLAYKAPSHPLYLCLYPPHSLLRLFLTPRPNLQEGKYPHAINNDDSKGHRLVFLPNCPADLNRMEYPLKKGTPYDGGKNNKGQGDERVVYYYQKGKRGNGGHPKVTYCGLITHKGAKAKGGFVNCHA
ncbi:hypothetical protein IAQ61_007990 [Plenodomus lingam]|uniref:Uncharacterized protein n=1 Tax=Leptosphaeria maculans (strain JN3 / isolate v23.1.3 / race Av1-4-5-6-7-8) TaxID=985895 RepID=E5A0K8_LEPMJ|nr:hypothetical protein LEMA_P101990.1 [Plenodomus lingam JN3]KAH9867397.1 hypothetical protein IAQ61_007990 [Plenodomus lingam]CBX97068.1 hypothetical protein LEMA_P101990.1 [Plenodomus lingam JN3]